MATPEKRGGASSWGTNQAGEVQGLEGILQSSRDIREAIRARVAGPWSGLQHVNIPFTNYPTNEALGDVVSAVNPLPERKADLALAVVPFARVMDEINEWAPRLFMYGQKSGLGPRFDTPAPVRKYVSEKIAPRIMRMVTKANKAQVDYMDPRDQADWLSEHVLRGVRDKTGKIHWSDPGEDVLHADIVSSLLDQGIDVDEEDIANYFFKWDNEVVDYELGSNLESAWGRYSELSRGTR